MNPQTTSYLALLFSIIGLAAVLIKLEIQGNPKKREHLKTLTLIHRVLGYLFIFIFVMTSVFMMVKVSGYQQELVPRALVHVVLALFLMPMIVLKWLIVRRFKRFFSYLPVLGSMILANAFVLSAMTAGYVFLHRSEVRYTTVSKAGLYEAQIAGGLFLTKCGKCHVLERALLSSKNQEGWTKTVNRMAQKDIPNIRPFDIKQIIHYLLEREKGRRGPPGGKGQDLTGEDLIHAKCTMCHKLERVYKARKDLTAWQKTLGNMVDNAAEIGVFDFLTEKEKDKIIRFLANRQSGTRTD